MCKSTFLVRQGRAYFGVRAEEPNYTIAMQALAEGNSLRGTGRIVDVDKNTICDWVDRAGRHCRAVRGGFAKVRETLKHLLPDSKLHSLQHTFVNLHYSSPP
jgi:hypothetical protein